MLIKNFQKYPLEVPRSCFVGVAWSFFHLLEVPIEKQNIISSHIHLVQCPIIRYCKSSSCEHPTGYPNFFFDPLKAWQLSPSFLSPPSRGFTAALLSELTLTWCKPKLVGNSLCLDEKVLKLQRFDLEYMYCESYTINEECTLPKLTTVKISNLIVARHSLFKSVTCEGLPWTHCPSPLHQLKCRLRYTGHKATLS